MDVRQLVELGFTEGESKVYLALLNLGESTVGPIVKESKIAYSNVYEVLNRLLEKGLASFIIKEKTKHFKPAYPTRILEYIDKQEKLILEKKEKAMKILPDLEKQIKITKEKEEAEIFIGEKGLKTAYGILTDELNKQDEILFFYVHDLKYYEKSENLYMNTWPELKLRKIKARGISNEEYYKTNLAKKASPFIKQKYVSFPVPGNIDISKDKILITTLKEKPIGILIHSREIADNFRNYFEAVWEIASIKPKK